MKLSLSKFAASKFYGIFNINSQAVPFIILTRSRTGSSFLVETLSMHPNIIARGEVFRKSRIISPSIIMDFIWKRHSRNIRAAGFKIFYYHPNDGENEAIWTKIAKKKGLKIIHLTRENYLSLAASREFASHTSSFHNYSQPGEKTLVSIEADIPSAIENLNQAEEFKEKRLDQLENSEMIEVSYEYFTENYQECMKTIYDFLGVKAIYSDVKIRSSGINDYRSVIKNYDALKKSIEDAGYNAD
ncbi:hypothetical protein V6617_02420 [Pelagibacterium nitratireducens]|uniref:Sulphotransferase Stf0 domain-containing protein n=1 Tax=Pelagibacterium nitratireducens TaxID=1046114 RepID=A0ABZ2I750_9HYPH